MGTEDWGRITKFSAIRHSSLAIRHLPLATRHSPLIIPDYLRARFNE